MTAHAAPTKAEFDDLRDSVVSKSADPADEGKVPDAYTGLPITVTPGVPIAIDGGSPSDTASYSIDGGTP